MNKRNKRICFLYIWCNIENKKVNTNCIKYITNDVNPPAK